MVVAKYAQLFSGFGSYRQRKELSVGFITVIYDTQGLITQTVIYVAEVEVVDTSDCHSEDSGFEPRRSRQPDTDALIASYNFICNTCFV